MRNILANYKQICALISGLGARHCTHLDWLRTNWTNIRLPPLFAEIFDIPKSEDDLN